MLKQSSFVIKQEEVPKPILENVWTLGMKQKKIKKQNSEKNICRYITRQCIRSFIDKIYESKVLALCQNNLNLYESSQSLLKSNIELISGQRALNDFLNYSETTEELRIKQVFRQFMVWFLKERYIRYIISGNMANKKQYIKYKNQVMLQLINKTSSRTGHLTSTSSD